VFAHLNFLVRATKVDIRRSSRHCRHRNLRDDLLLRATSTECATAVNWTLRKRNGWLL
jgi:hypothetical protein